MRTGKLICLILALFPTVLLRADEVQETLNRLTASMRTVRTIQSDFVQTKHLNMLSHSITIRGVLCLDRSGKVAWHVLEPIRYSCILEKTKFTQWDADSNKETVININIHPAFRIFAENMQAYFSGDLRKMIRNYSFSLVKGSGLELKPKKGTLPSKIFESVRLQPSPDESYIRSIEIRELNGDTTTLELTNTRLNKPVPEALWRIQVK